MQGPPLLPFLALVSIYTTGRRATPQELSVGIQQDSLIDNPM